jgi:two-component system, chemotaxis family, sensor kinase CheA
MTDNSLLQDFIVETGEHLADTERNLLRLEQQPEDTEVLNEIFRSIHTIKGSSEYLGLERVAELSHKLENLLDLLRRGERHVDGAVTDVLIGTHDRIAQLVDDLAQHQQERTSIDDLVSRIDECCGHVKPVSAEEVTAGTTPQGYGEAIEDEYDEELFGIFLDQLGTGLQALCEETRKLQAGEAGDKALARYEDRLGTLRSSANYMGYEKLRQVYVQWSQAVAQTIERFNEGEAIDWGAFARDVTVSNLDRVKRFFPKVDLLQQLTLQVDEPEAAVSASVMSDDSEGATEELRFDDIGIELAADDLEADDSEKGQPSPEMTLSPETQDAAADSSDILEPSLLQDFIVETGEHLADTERNLLRLEQQPEDTEVLNEIFRSIHTIKGSSEYLGLERVAELSHKLENLLDLLRRGERHVDGAVTDVLIGTHDRIAQLVDDLAQHQQERTSIDDLVSRIDEFCGHVKPVSAEEVTAGTTPQGYGEAIEDEYDEELFGIFLDQLGTGLQALCEETRKLQAGEAGDKALARYEDRLETLRSSANYMGYEKLRQVYVQWSQAVAQTVERFNEGEAIDWGAFARDVTVSNLERVKRLFPKADLLQQLALQADEPQTAEIPTSALAPVPPSEDSIESAAAEVDSELLADFIAETDEQLDDFEHNLSGLERQTEETEDGVFSEMFRSIHTIKGSSEYLGLQHIAELSCALEKLLDLLRHRKLMKHGDLVEVLSETKVRIWQLVDDLVKHGSEQTSVQDLISRIEVCCNPDACDDGGQVVAEPQDQKPAGSGFVYEESYDQELFAIFSQQLVRGLSVLEKEAQEAKSGGNAQSVIDNCEKQLKKLKSSANYMEYFELKEIYDQWISDLNALHRRLAEGLAVDWTDWADREVPERLARIRGFFDLSQIPVQTQAAAMPPPESAAEVAVTEALEDQNLDSAEGQSEAVLSERVDIDDHVDATMEQSLLDRLEKAFDSKMASFADSRTDPAFHPDVVKELLSDEETIERLAAMPRVSLDYALDQSSSQRDPKPAGDLESLLFSDLDRPRAPSKPLAPKPLADLGEIQEQAVAPLAMEAADDRRGRFTMGRRQTDKFRDRLLKQSIRVDAAKIDTLMNQVGELVVTRAGFNQLFSEMREFQLMLKQAQKLDGRESQTIKDLTSRINAATISLSRITSELQENVMKVRMLPIAQLFSRYPRVVHDLVRNSQKQVDLDIRGEETELDRMVIEQISDPLVHVIRNAVDHGIEPVQERQRKGKPETGTLRLEAYHEGNYVVIEISDDGGGIDTEKIRSRALAKGFITPEESDSMSEEELTALIMRPGFSTADEVTHTSGRGVGMDVVKDHIEKLNGSIGIESTPGRGTLFRIKIPLTLAIIQALMVRVAGEIFTIPLSAVDETIRIRRSEISTIEGMEVYYLREHALPLIRPAQVFKMESHPDTQEIFVVVVSTGNRQVGLVVDQLMRREEVVIKPLEDYLQEKSGFSGATILGDGSISLILDVVDLVHLAVDQYQKAKVPAI